MSQRLLYVCEGGDCTECGSGDLHDVLKERVTSYDPKERAGEGAPLPVLRGCEVAINVTVFPDRIFYSKVTKEDIPEIVDHLLGDGAPVKRLMGHVQPTWRRSSGTCWIRLTKRILDRNDADLPLKNRAGRPSPIAIRVHCEVKGPRSFGGLRENRNRNSPLLPPLPGSSPCSRHRSANFEWPRPPSPGPWRRKRPPLLPAHRQLPTQVPRRSRPALQVQALREGFSRQTFRMDYCDNKPHLNAPVFRLLASGWGYARPLGFSVSLAAPLNSKRARSLAT